MYLTLSSSSTCRSHLHSRESQSSKAFRTHRKYDGPVRGRRVVLTPSRLDQAQANTRSAWGLVAEVAAAQVLPGTFQGKERGSRELQRNPTWALPHHRR